MVLGPELAQPACREEAKAVQAVPSRNFAEEAKIERERGAERCDERGGNAELGEGLDFVLF